MSRHDLLIAYAAAVATVCLLLALFCPTVVLT